MDVLVAVFWRHFPGTGASTVILILPPNSAAAFA
jgi:hypothetical protein